MPTRHLRAWQFAVLVAMLVLWLFPQLAYFLPDLVYGAGSR